jgi:hypothetical protein
MASKNWPQVQQPPYVAPPLYENLQDVASSYSINGEDQFD